MLWVVDKTTTTLVHKVDCNLQVLSYFSAKSISTDYPESERDGQSHKAALNRVPADDSKQCREEHNAVADQLQVQPKPPGKEQFLQVNMLRSMYKNSNIKLKEDKS